MATTTLQIPMSTTLRDRATRVAAKQGFSSLQEAIRIFLSQFAENQVQLRFSAPAIKLSAKNDKRYDKIISEMEAGKKMVGPFTDIDQLMNSLNS